MKPTDKTNRQLSFMYFVSRHIVLLKTQCNGDGGNEELQMLTEGGCFVFSQIDRKGECGVCVR